MEPITRSRTVLHRDAQALKVSAHVVDMAPLPTLTLKGLLTHPVEILRFSPVAERYV